MNLKMLQEKREEMTTALYLATQMWKQGDLGVEKPSDEEMMQCTKYLDGIPHKDVEDADSKMFLSMLLSNNIGKHFKRVADHRLWIKRAYELLCIGDVLYRPERLKDIVKIHDLSKYGPDEALGYCIKFEKGEDSKLSSSHLSMWESAREHHYESNSHHPEYHRGYAMPLIDIQESIIDMIACRLERTLKGHYAITPDLIMDIPDRFLQRYGELQNVVKCLLNLLRSGLKWAITHSKGSQHAAFAKWELESGYKLKVEM